MARTASSRQWLERQRNDPYVKRAQREGYRSRAAYKLLDIQAKDQLLRPGQHLVDLGAAPGSWSQVAARIIGPSGRVIALDLLPIEPLTGVTILEGDFRESEAIDRLNRVLGDTRLDLVLSDMAPNITGTVAVDQPRAMYLVELALEFARERLQPGGSMIVKVFQGEGFDRLLAEMRRSFDRVASRKPESSRSRSRELYVVAKGFHP
jgi:23S rRNA (uridine2552-2'-O)-methyltransferase